MTSFGLRLSKIGSLASLVCAIHCALTPIALLSLPFILAHSSGEWHGIPGMVFGENTEWLFLGGIGLLAGFGLLATYPVHRDKRPAYVSGIGLGLLLISRVWMDHQSPGEIALDITGACVIAWAGFWNRRLCHCVGCHPHEQ
ncbi:MAG: MerC domain-containing protein [Nitrospirales bacterium]